MSEWPLHDILLLSYLYASIAVDYVLWLGDMLSWTQQKMSVAKQQQLLLVVKFNSAPIAKYHSTCNSRKNNDNKRQPSAVNVSHSHNYNVSNGNTTTTPIGYNNSTAVRALTVILTISGVHFTALCQHEDDRRSAESRWWE
ncbi:unnamed protein product [Ceratitis capitata]|uniref:(Mediterranean fruit fly) hypothetical protein n=1 Tax=Ceratitis capitata TaxID=7213 RepID=A0A811VL61_CERCA|nr:unnamed protein product [Ceratitis capitata]